VSVLCVCVCIFMYLSVCLSVGRSVCVPVHGFCVHYHTLQASRGAIRINSHRRVRACRAHAYEHEANDTRHDHGKTHFCTHVHTRVCALVCCACTSSEYACKCQHLCQTARKKRMCVCVCVFMCLYIKIRASHRSLLHTHRQKYMPVCIAHI
jgi:hypothetical protein